MFSILNIIPDNQFGDSEIFKNNHL
ncbi:hypothetical protein LCGC14_2683580, partial [marine sediment metagenome]